MAQICSHGGTDDRWRYSSRPPLVLCRLPRSVSLNTNSASVPRVTDVVCSLTDVAAIWNANAFFAYVITAKMFKLPWEGKRIFAVLLATAGVMAVIYGGASIQGSGSEQPEVSRVVPTAPLLGDLLTLVASVGYGLYQVLYKRYLALPPGPEVEGPSQSSYAPIPRMSFDGVIEPDPFTDDPTPGDSQLISDTTVYPPPFGLHPNLLTSLVGVLTFLFLWIPLPVLHYVGAEPFHWPTNWYVALAISGIALSGVVFNAGFMVISWSSICTIKM